MEIAMRDTGSYGNENLGKAEREMGKSKPIPVTTRSALGGGVRVRVERQEPEFIPVAVKAPETAIKRLQALLREEGMAAVLKEINGRKILQRDRLDAIAWRDYGGQLGACDWFCELYAEYLKAIDSKSGMKSGSAERVSKGEPP